MSCLDFADDSALLEETDEEAISYEKTEFIKVTIKYLGEMVREMVKLERLSFAKGNIYNKKNPYSNAKIRHYNTVIKSAILYGMETICN